MAAGGGYCCGPPQKRERARLWECRQFLSTQNEQCETRRARGDFQLVNRSRMVSLSRADKKKKKSRPGKVYVWETLELCLLGCLLGN